MFNNSTVNVYGGALLALYNQNMAFSQKAIHCSKNCTVNVFDGLISTIAGNRSDSSLNNKINLYGGTFGNDFLKNANNVAAIWHDPYLGTIKAGKIYGLEGDAALADYKPAGFRKRILIKPLRRIQKYILTVCSHQAISWFRSVMHIKISWWKSSMSLILPSIASP